MTLSSAPDNEFADKIFVDALGREFKVEEKQDDQVLLRFVASQIPVKQTVTHFLSQKYKVVLDSEAPAEEEAA